MLCLFRRNVWCREGYPSAWGAGGCCCAGPVVCVRRVADGRDSCVAREEASFGRATLSERLASAVLAVFSLAARRRRARSRLARRRGGPDSRRLGGPGALLIWRSRAAPRALRMAGGVPSRGAGWWTLPRWL